MKFLLKLVVLGGLIVGGLWVYGRTLPRDHQATSSITLVTAPDSVYALIRNFERSPAWWSDVRSVRRISGKRRESWEQDMGPGGKVQLEVTSEVPGRRLVTTILNDEQKDWGGTWVYAISESAAGTELIIIEKGWIESPLFRVISRLMGGPHKTMDSCLRSVGAHFGETVTPRHDDSPEARRIRGMTSG